MAAEQDRLVKVIDAVDARTVANARHLNELAHQLDSERELRVMRDRGINATLTILASVEILGRELARFSAVLHGALSYGRASPELFRAGEVMDVMRQVSKEPSKKGMTVATDHLPDFWKFPVSVGTFTSEVVRIVIHVPLMKKTDLYDLLVPSPVPFGIANSTLFGEARCPRGHDGLLVSPTRDRFFEGTLTETAGWFKAQDSWLFYGSRPIRREDRESCLWGLYQGRTEQVKETCNVVSAGRQLRIHQVGPTEFVVFAPREDRLDVWCGDKRVASAVFAGLKKVTVEPGCLVQGRDVYVAAARHLERGHAHVKAARSEERRVGKECC